IKAKPQPPSQTIWTDDDEGVTVKLNLKITNDFVMALLSRARSLEVISPLHLRERIRQTLSDALRRNS
ncbi:MAG: WYL domain-containing protein, partial [Muribaculaceae bacterium]|nr:WYL domain-containing protein [Muribaculaceae bacterium]